MEKVITKIEVQKRNKDRVNVHINGEFAFSCSAELVYTNELKQNKAVDVDMLQEVVFQDNYLKCKNSALRIIERSHKTEKEVYDKLVLKGYDEKTIAKAMEFLKSYNLINDEAYSKLYIKEKLKSQGINKIKNALLRKGLDKELVEEKLDEVNTTEEYNTAFKLAERKYAVIVKSERDYRKTSKKLWEYLMRNGYSSEIIEEILKKIVIEEVEEVTEEESTASLDEVVKIAKKRYNIIIKSESDKKKINKKLTDFLLRRGFSYDTIKTALRQILE